MNQLKTLANPFQFAKLDVRTAVDEKKKGSGLPFDIFRRSSSPKALHFEALTCFSSKLI